MSVLRGVAAALVACLLAVGFTFASPAEAQQTGLVNVEIGDVLSHNRVGIGVAANVAATVCAGVVQVGVIAEQIARTGAFECETRTGQQLVITRVQ